MEAVCMLAYLMLLKRSIMYIMVNCSKYCYHKVSLKVLYSLYLMLFKVKHMCKCGTR